MKHIDFIINPISGTRNKKDIVGLIEKGLDRSKYTYSILYTKGPGDATGLARASKADIVCSVGGDGTLNEVASGLVGSDKALALIPCGSGDGLAIHLGISRKPAKAIEILNNGVLRTIDSATVNGRPFFSICGTGLDAIVSHRFTTSGKRGLKTYITEALKTWKDFKPETYRISIDGREYELGAAILAIGNSDQWGNNARITSLADASDGLLNLTIIKSFKTVDIPGLVLKLMTGNIHKSRLAVCETGREIVISAASRLIGHFDGDPTVFDSPMTIRINPSSIKVIVPKR